MLVQSRDITEQKRAEERMRQLAVLSERNRIAREISDALTLQSPQNLLPLKAVPQNFSLTRRELNVLYFLVPGHSNKEIAGALQRILATTSLIMEGLTV